MFPVLDLFWTVEKKSSLIGCCFEAALLLFLTFSLLLVIVGFFFQSK
jgi:hypothetical protein